MKLRTYHAYTMDEALAAVKHDLGSDAVILNTRTFTRRSMLGMRSRTIVEVTAAPPEDSFATPLRKASANAEGEWNAETETACAVLPVTDDDREKTRRLAIAMAAKFSRERRLRPVEVHTAPPDADGVSTTLPSEPHSTVATEGRLHNPLDAELAAIKAMVGQVLARQSNGGLATPSLPQHLLDHYNVLLEQDVSQELVDQIIGEVRDGLPPEQLEEEHRVHAAVVERLAACIPVADEPMTLASPDGRPLTIALVGPTGVGKTTTLAKLAAMFKLHHRKRVGLITADTYRIAAVDQLRTYANIIGLPLQVALAPAEMRQAVHRLSDCDVILIDTAGRSQNDVLRIDELRQFIEACSPHEVHLVLSGTAGEKVLRREAEAFGEVGVDKIVLTKLDETVSFGALVSVIHALGKEVSFITTGQEVPDHIEPACAARLATMVLGGKLHT